MNNEQIVNKTIEFIKQTLRGAESGHDWFHAERVWKTARRIAENEQVNVFVVELAALLHDVADSKFHDGDEEIGARTARLFLETLSVDNEILEHVANIILNISFKGGNVELKFFSPEFAVVQDADRLDAIGAIGIARTFSYGGFKNREMYNPDIQPNLTMTKEEYKNSTAPTINHFYEKLLLLKHRMHTETARVMAQNRHDFMLQFLDEFYKEWDGEL